MGAVPNFQDGPQFQKLSVAFESNFRKPPLFLRVTGIYPRHTITKPRGYLSASNILGIEINCVRRESLLDQEGFYMLAYPSSCASIAGYGGAGQSQPTRN